MKSKFTFSILLLILLTSLVWAQHRGDLLSFQGVDEVMNGGMESMALGNAFTAMKGSIDNLFLNPAGLTGITKFTFSINGNNYKKTWWENQAYRPNRYFVTLPFYLEGMYIPDPKNNGVLDRDLALDSNYVVSKPSDWGKRVDSKEAADWIRDKSASVFNHFAFAAPIHLFGKNMVIAGAYQQKVNFLDFDRNDTYLLPLIGSSSYAGWISRVNGQDTLNVHWFRYLRERGGDLKSFRFALSAQVMKNLSVGVVVDRTSGESSDLMQLNKMGYFGLVDENKFFFTYDTLNYQEKGKSEFSEVRTEIGFLYEFENLSLGLDITFPRTLKRRWHYVLSEKTAESEQVQNISGEDRAKIPAILNFGLTFKPIPSFLFSLAYRYAPYSKTSFKLARNDTTFRSWANQHTYMFGVRYQLDEYFTLMGGYRWEPALFVPDGVAYTDRGPEKIIYSLGGKLSLGKLGSLVIASEFRTLKYHDTYFSNTNYATEKLQNYSIGYVYQF